MGTDPKKLDLYGRTALFDCRDLEIAQLLVDHGVDPNLKDKDGATAFYYYHDARIANYLIDKGLDVNNTTMVKGITPLFVCHDKDVIYVKDKDVVSFLVKNGVDPTVVDNDGKTCSWNVKQIKNKNTIKIHGEFKSESYYSEFEEEFQKRYFSGRLYFFHDAYCNLSPKRTFIDRRPINVPIFAASHADERQKKALQPQAGEL